MNTGMRPGRAFDARRAMVFAALLIACVGCDQATKHLAVQALSGAPVTAIAGDAIRLELAANPGAFLSAGAGLPEPLRRGLFLGAVPLLLALLSIFALRGGQRSRRSLAGLALVLGGGLSNWLDRLLHDGHVTDFVSLGLGGFRTGIFNVADVLVLAGVALLVTARPGDRSAAPAEAPGGPP